MILTKSLITDTDVNTSGVAVKGCKELLVSSLSSIAEGFPMIRIVEKTLIRDMKQRRAVVKRVCKMRQTRVPILVCHLLVMRYWDSLLLCVNGINNCSYCIELKGFNEIKQLLHDNKGNISHCHL